MHVRRSSRPPHGLPRSQRRGQDDRHACGVRPGRTGCRRGEWRGAPHRAGGADEVRLHARGAGPVPAHAGARAAASTSASCAAGPGSDVARSVDAWLERLDLADRGQGPPRRPVARQPAARPADRRAGQRARPARARRAVLRSRSDRHGRSWPSCSPTSPPLARRCCSPAISSTWSRTCARTSSSSTTAASSSPASWRSCAPRCRSDSSTSTTAGRHPTGRRCPRSSSCASRDGEARLRIDRDADVAAVLAIARHTPDIVSFAYQPPTLSELFRQAVAA